MRIPAESRPKTIMLAAVTVAASRFSVNVTTMSLVEPMYVAPSITGGRPSVAVTGVAPRPLPEPSSSGVTPEPVGAVYVTDGVTSV